MPYLFSSHPGIWWQIVVGIMGLRDSTEKDCNNTWNSKKRQLAASIFFPRSFKGLHKKAN